MGIDLPSMALLAAGRGMGVDFTDTAMIGRQNFAEVAGGATVEEGLEKMFRTLKISQDARAFKEQNFFCENLFKLLGAKQVDSFDVSDYQQATHLHDMNRPIPAEFHERYSCVHDGGTIEHVFNIPQALKNCLQMVRLGGHFTQVNVANNFMGHGFWQFSPEMIFRAISPENGFEIRVVLLHEAVRGGSWHVVSDPAKLRARVELCNAHPTYVMTIARRTAIADIFATPPQQSDYVAEWGGGGNATPPPPRATSRTPLIARVLRRLRRVALGTPAFNPRHYRKVSENQVWLGEF